MKVKWLLIILFLFWLTGYVREFFFVNLNSIMYEKYYGHTSLPVPTSMQLFTHFSYKTLYFSKYIYTLVWVIVFYLLGSFSIRKLSGEKKLIAFLTYSYLILLLLAGTSMVYGYFVKERLQDDEYTLSRWLLGIAQSPIICLILLASEKLYNKSFRT
jgi:hypothetical protein